MPQQTLLLSFFSFGVIFQIMSIIWKNRNNKQIFLKLSWCLLGSILILLVAFLKGVDDMFFLLFSFITIFTFSFAAFFREEILPVMNEKKLLIFTLIFWYAWISYIGHQNIINFPLIYIAFPFSILVGFVVFTNFRVPFALKVLLQIWFFIIVFSLGVALFIPVSKDVFTEKIVNFTSFDAFLYGQSYFYLLANLFYLLAFIPLTGKRQRFSERMKEWKEYVDLLARKYDKTQLNLWKSFSFLIFLGTVFICNYSYKIIPIETLIGLCILFFSLRERLTFLQKGEFKK